MDYISDTFPYPLVDRLELVGSVPLILQGWKKHLISHPDFFFKQTIFDIIEYGAKIGYTGPDQFIIGENLSSATEAPEIITKDLENQIVKDQVTKIDILPPKFISSPLGLVPKPKKGGGKFIICHFPKDVWLM